MQTDEAVKWLDATWETHVGALQTFLRFPSVSAWPERADDMQGCAVWLRDRLEAAGLQARVMQSAGHPVVYADSGAPSEREDALTLLLYGHYDVQPPGDLSLWETPPFEPTLRDRKLYARGSADNKGQLMTHLVALQCLREIQTALPIRIKCLYEGEEEIGSAHLAEFVRDHADVLGCDAVVVTDASRLDSGQPALFYATRGLVYKQIAVDGPVRDLHSGHFGGTVANPANVLARLLGDLHDRRGRVAIPGFYAGVRRLSPKERRWLERTGMTDTQVKAKTGVPEVSGEKRFPSAQRCTARPTLDVNGLVSGYTEQGAATIIPARAVGKVSMRLVPDQDPEKVSSQFDDALRSACPPSVRLTIETLSMCAAYRSPTDTRFFRAATDALTASYHQKPPLAREGGTLPILPMFKKILGADSLVTGFADADCHAHAPNEFFGLGDLKKGILTLFELVERCAALRSF